MAIRFTTEVIDPESGSTFQYARLYHADYLDGKDIPCVFLCWKTKPKYENNKTFVFRWQATLPFASYDAINKPLHRAVEEYFIGWNDPSNLLFGGTQIHN